MEEVIISQERILDNITLEDQYKYSAYITIGLMNSSDFYVKIEFNDLELETLKQVHELYKLPKALKITSKLITKEGYNITHIVTTSFSSGSDLSMIWECLSDDPNNSLEL